MEGPTSIGGSSWKTPTYPGGGNDALGRAAHRLGYPVLGARRQGLHTRQFSEGDSDTSALQPPGNLPAAPQKATMPPAEAGVEAPKLCVFLIVFPPLHLSLFGARGEEAGVHGSPLGACLPWQRQRCP